MLRRLSPLLLLLIAACVAGFTGYQQGFEAVVVRPVLEKSRVTDGAREEPRETRPAKMSRLMSLSTRIDSSHAAMIESWRIIRTFSVDEIRQALAGMPAGHKGVMADGLLVPMLYSRWAEIDPQAALDSKESGFEKTLSFKAAFTTWMNRDPEAAYHWAKSKPEFADLASDMMARSMSREMPADALARTISGNEKLGEAVTVTLAARMSATPEGRAAFLAELAKRGPEELAAGKIQLLSAWGRDDPQAALEGMDALGLDPPDAESKRELILSSWARWDPGSALAWMVGKPDALPLERRTQIFNNWAEHDSAAALTHFDTLVRAPGFAEAVVSQMLLEQGQVMMNASGGGDLWAEAHRSTMRTCYQRWSAQAPEAAARWRDGLDPELRKELQP